MSEIYWITRLDSIHCVFSILAIICTIVTFVTIIFFAEGDDPEAKSFFKVSKRSFFIVVFSIIISIFVPTSKEALMIWGIGGTIDYIKSNDTVKQLPDKCIDALDKFIDEYSEKDEKDEKD